MPLEFLTVRQFSAPKSLSCPLPTTEFLSPGSRGGRRACEPGLARKASSPRRPSTRKVEQGLAAAAPSRPGRTRRPAEGRRHFRLRAALPSFCGALAPLPSPSPALAAGTPRPHLIRGPPKSELTCRHARPPARPPVGSAAPLPVPRRCRAAGRPSARPEDPGRRQERQRQRTAEATRRRPERARSRTGTRAPGRTCVPEGQDGCAGAQRAAEALPPARGSSPGALQRRRAGLP